MIVLLEEPEAWSLMMLVSAVAVDNAELSEEGREAIRQWRGELREGSDALAQLTDDINVAMNQHIDSKFVRRVKSRGKRAETLKR
jgi:hypothetical protein